MNKQITLKLNYDEAVLLAKLSIMAYERDMGLSKKDDNLFNVVGERLIRSMKKNKWW